MVPPVKNRIKKTAEFDSVFRNGKTVLGVFLFLKVRTGIELPRFAVVVPGSVIRKASQRNRIRRVLSHVMKELIGGIREPADIIVVLTKKAAVAGEKDITIDLRRTIKKLQAK